MRPIQLSLELWGGEPQPTIEELDKDFLKKSISDREVLSRVSELLHDLHDSELPLGRAELLDRVGNTAIAIDEYLYKDWR